MRYFCIVTGALVAIACPPLKAENPPSPNPPAQVLSAAGVTQADVDELLRTDSPDMGEPGDWEGRDGPGGRGPGGRGHGPRPRHSWIWLLPFEWRQALLWHLENRHYRWSWGWDRHAGWHWTREWYWDDHYGRRGWRDHHDGWRHDPGRYRDHDDRRRGGRGDEGRGNRGKEGHGGRGRGRRR